MPKSPLSNFLLLRPQASDLLTCRITQGSIRCTSADKSGCFKACYLPEPSSVFPIYFHPPPLEMDAVKSLSRKCTEPLHVLYLFTKSDFKTTVIPIVSLASNVHLSLISSKLISQCTDFPRSRLYSPPFLVPPPPLTRRLLDLATRPTI